MTNKYVLLRGLVRGNGHWGNFLTVLKAINPRAEIEIYEIPGNGTRCQETTPLDPFEVISDFRQRSEFVRNKEPFILCGISLGGMLALKWVELFPEEIAKAFVVNSSLKSLSPFFHRLRFENYLLIMRIFLVRSSDVREHRILEITSNRNDLDPKIIDQLVTFSRNHPVSEWNVFRQLYLAGKIHISQNLNPSIKIIQSIQDRLVDPKCSQKIAEYLQAELIVHPTAGHDIPLDDPEWLAKQLIVN